MRKRGQTAQQSIARQQRHTAENKRNKQSKQYKQAVLTNKETNKQY